MSTFNLKDTIIFLGILVAILANLVTASGKLWGGIAFTFILVLFGCVYLYLRFPTRGRPPTKIIEQNCTLSIKKPDGSLAHYVKSQKFKPLENNITRLVERGIHADGNVANFQVSEGDVTVSNEAGSIIATISYDHPLPKAEMSRKLSFNYIDSFTNNKEYFFQNIFSDIPKGELSIEFPIERKCTDIKAFIVTGGAEQNISSKLQKIDSENGPVKWSIHYTHIPAGSHIRIEWIW